MDRWEGFVWSTSPCLWLIHGGPANLQEAQRTTRRLGDRRVGTRYLQ